MHLEPKVRVVDAVCTLRTCLSARWLEFRYSVDRNHVQVRLRPWSVIKQRRSLKINTNSNIPMPQEAKANTERTPPVTKGGAPSLC